MNIRESTSSELTRDGLAVINPRWSNLPRLLHGMTTRTALPQAGKTDFFQVIIQMRAAGIVPGILTLGGKQVHADHIEVITQMPQAEEFPANFRFNRKLSIGEFADTDALATTLPGVLLVIKTADCLPIFFIDPTHQVLGLAHCGWKGLRANLPSKMVKTLCDLGATATRLQVWLGSCVRVENYEVGAAMVKEFAQSFPGAPVSPNGTHLDIPGIARQQLQDAGLLSENIFDSGHCTRARTDLYHSYRAQGVKAGRMFSFIGME